jgi:predicted PhzF superfamily epimerase YddE/YHI9
VFTLKALLYFLVYFIRFTPSVEVELCGHATLAAAHALYETGRVPAMQLITFRTLHSGTLTAQGKEDGSIELNFPAAPVQPLQLDDTQHALLLSAFGLTGEEVVFVGSSLYDMVVEVTREAFARIAAVAVNHAQLAELGGRGVLLTTRGQARAAAPVQLSDALVAQQAAQPRSPRAAVVNDPRFDILMRGFFPR